jgi:hypothetical protein
MRFETRRGPKEALLGNFKSFKMKWSIPCQQGNIAKVAGPLHPKPKILPSHMKLHPHINQTSFIHSSIGNSQMIFMDE